MVGPSSTDAYGQKSGYSSRHRNMCKSRDEEVVESSGTAAMSFLSLQSNGYRSERVNGNVGTGFNALKTTSTMYFMVLAGMDVLLNPIAVHLVASKVQI